MPLTAVHCDGWSRTQRTGWECFVLGKSQFAKPRVFKGSSRNHGQVSGQVEAPGVKVCRRWQSPAQVPDCLLPSQPGLRCRWGSWSCLALCYKAKGLETSRVIRASHVPAEELEARML